MKVLIDIIALLCVIAGIVPLVTVYIRAEEPDVYMDEFWDLFGYGCAFFLFVVLLWDPIKAIFAAACYLAAIFVMIKGIKLIGRLLISMLNHWLGL